MVYSLFQNNRCHLRSALKEERWGVRSRYLLQNTNVRWAMELLEFMWVRNPPRLVSLWNEIVESRRRYSKSVHLRCVAYCVFQVVLGGIFVTNVTLLPVLFHLFKKRLAENGCGALTLSVLWSAIPLDDSLALQAIGWNLECHFIKVFSSPFRHLKRCKEMTVVNLGGHTLSASISYRVD